MTPVFALGLALLLIGGVAVAAAIWSGHIPFLRAWTGAAPLEKDTADQFWDDLERLHAGRLDDNPETYATADRHTAQETK